MANEIITLAELKEYLGISDSDDDSLLEAIRDRSTDAVESFLDYNVNAREYHEWHDGVGGRRVVLREPNVTNVYIVRTGVATALTVSGNVSTDIAATVMVVNNSLSLHRTDTNGDETTTTYDLTNASYNTTSDLATVISSVTGFSATLGTNTKSEWLHNLGAVDVTSTSFNMTYADISESNFRLDYPEGILYLRSDPAFVREDSVYGEPALPRTRQSIFVNYRAGWTSPYPADIVQATLEIAAGMYQRREHDQNLQSESLGDYSYSMRNPAEVRESTRALLLPYRKVR